MKTKKTRDPLPALKRSIIRRLDLTQVAALEKWLNCRQRELRDNASKVAQARAWNSLKGMITVGDALFCIGGSKTVHCSYRIRGTANSGVTYYLTVEPGVWGRVHAIQPRKRIVWIRLPNDRLLVLKPSVLVGLEWEVRNTANPEFIADVLKASAKQLDKEMVAEVMR